MLEIKKYGLHVYELPPCDEDEDESFKAKDKQMKASIDECRSVFVSYSCNVIFVRIFNQQPPSLV